MTLQEVYLPIQKEIDGVKTELGKLAEGFSFPSVEEIVRRFFQRPGKLLRPALLFLAARAVQPEPSEELRLRLLQTAFALELIHSASLIHDDIVDGDLDRRGQPTLNRSWGNKTALLIGDAVYSRAFGCLTRVLSSDLLLCVVQMNEAMCAAEIEQAQIGPDIERLAYFRIIEGKTARFMSLCCVLGASLSGAGESEILTCQNFGLNFGLAYQLFDDTVDQDLPVPGFDGPKEAVKTLEKARNELQSLPESVARDHLGQLCAYLFETSPQPARSS